MAAPRILILRAPGTNCDQETAYAFELAGGLPEVAHINRVIEDHSLVENAQILCLPGGFSYGDDIAAGRIVAGQIRHRLADVLQQLRDHGKLILGICNGFQILLKSGMLLPDLPNGMPPATLTWNDSGRFEDRWVNLQVTGDRCVFLRGIESLQLPIAHAEGKFVASSDDIMASLNDRQQLTLRYSTPDQNGTPAGECLPFPWNPNGSQQNVAGVCDESGRVFGLMPHPERFVDATHHPQWTRRNAQGEGEGLRVFRNAVEFFG